MSTRFEWFDAHHTHLEYVAPGDCVQAHDDPDDCSTECIAEVGALVISADSVAVLHGSPDELRALLERASKLLRPNL